MKPVWASVARVLVAATLALFADDSCLTAAFVVINGCPFGIAGVLTIITGCVKGFGLFLQVFVVGRRGSGNVTLNIY